MSDLQELNARVIAEFRANGGVVGGPWEGMPLLLLHTTGARSGRPRINPLAFLGDGDAIVVFASNAAAPAHPSWFHNLIAQPDVTVEVGTETFPARARVTDGDERERLFAGMVERHPGFAEYQARTTRQIPVVVLERL